jgi:tetratricopeptide (TPR) repeat protein
VRSQRQTRPRKKAVAASKPSSASPDPRWMAVFLVLVVLIAYFPALDGFFLWDDDAHVTRPDLRSLGGLWRIWFDLGATQQYYPLLHSAFWLEHKLWGNDVLGYHLVNVLLHATSACLVLLILRRLKIAGAGLAAAIFALHPVHVESVAWISEQKNTLSMVFYLAAMHAYLRFDETRKQATYLVATGLFVLGLLTKTVVATLPGALLVVFWWRRGRLVWRQDVLPLTPWFALGAAAGMLTAWIERRLLGAEGAEFALTFVQRTLLASRVVGFYLGKLVWPAHLTFMYPRWQIDSSAWSQYLFTLGVLLTLIVCWLVRGRARAPLAVSLFFIGTLFPVLGFFNVYPFVFAFVADHFQYVPSLAIIAAASASLSMLLQRVDARAPWLHRVAGTAVLLTLGTLTWRQSHVYRDPQTLYEATLAQNPQCYLCLNNLGTMSFQSGRVADAVERFRQAVRIEPASAEAQNNLANVLVEAGSIAEGIEHYRQALRAAPNNVMTHTNLGIALFRLGRVSEARAQFEEALRIMPEYAPARQNLSAIQALPSSKH